MPSGTPRVQTEVVANGRTRREWFRTISRGIRQRGRAVGITPKEDMDTKVTQLRTRAEIRCFRQEHGNISFGSLDALYVISI